MEEVAFPNLSPSVCFSCEGVPPGAAFVDTLNNFDPPSVTTLNGRKYLCEFCITEAAHALGLLEDAAAPIQAQLEQVIAKNEQLQADLDSFESIKNLVDTLASRPVIEVETSVEEAVAAVKAKKTARTKKVVEAQEADAAVKAGAEEGAAAQAVLDQEAADRQQANVDAAAALAANPLPEPEQVIPVTAPPTTGLPGQVWNGSDWVDPESPIIDLTPVEPAAEVAVEEPAVVETPVETA